LLAAGRQHHHRDGRPRLGPPQALTAVDAQHILAATQGGVYETQNGGKTFVERLTAGSNGRH
ncbi:exo-alpha-sialidase, partial [Streptomyces sp. NPDC050636]